jgi:hypothetical protein
MFELANAVLFIFENIAFPNGEVVEIVILDAKVPGIYPVQTKAA